jgi:hypothetical protein
VDEKCHAFVTSALGGGEYSVLHSSFFTYEGKKKKFGGKQNQLDKVER